MVTIRQTDGGVGGGAAWTGLHQNYYRDGYMASQGRYTQSDSISNIDPNGLLALSPVVIGGGIVGGILAYHILTHSSQTSTNNPTLTGIIPPQDFPNGISWPPRNEPTSCCVEGPPPKLPPPQKPDCDTVFAVCRASVAQSSIGVFSKAIGYSACLTAYAICRKVIGGGHD